MARELRKITQKELDKILEDHKLWLESDGEKGKKADLSYTNLSGLNLGKVNLEKADLEKADLEKAYLFKAILKDANLFGANLFGTYLFATNFEGANLREADIRQADARWATFEGANLDNARYSISILENDYNIYSKHLPKKDIILDTESQIQSLEEEKKELQEKLQQASTSNQEEKERLKEVEAQLEQAEQTIQREQEAKKKTKTQIETAVGFLKNPNDYIAQQIKNQNILMKLYVILSILIIGFFVYYVSDNYSSFKNRMNPTTTFINWLFYASPLLISFSLIIVFINQINTRIQNIVHLNERKRYVDSVEGGLQAINALSINNEDARKKILDTMEKIIDHTLQSSEKANEPISLEEKAVEDPLTTLSKIKGLVK